MTTLLLPLPLNGLRLQSKPQPPCELYCAATQHSTLAANHPHNLRLASLLLLLLLVVVVYLPVGSV
jgi:hypothetical protein